MIRSGMRGTGTTIALAVAGALVAGCAGSRAPSLPGNLGDPRRHFQAERPEEAARALRAGVAGARDGAIHGLDLGAVLHASGDLAGSSDAFFGAVDRLGEVSRDDLEPGADEASLAYIPAGYERMLVHAYLAMNFLFGGEPESARLEIRRLEAARERAAREARDEAKRIRARASVQGITHRQVTRSVRGLYADQKPVSSRVEGSLDDAFGPALSAVIHDLAGADQDAYYELARAREARPRLAALKRDTVRAASRAGLPEVVRQLAGDRAVEVPDHRTELVVIFQSGDVPLREAIELTVPIGAGRVEVSLPRARTIANPHGGLAIEDAGGRVLGRTELYTDLEALAVRGHIERCGLLALGQALREGPGGRGAAADLRSWGTLPAELQLVRIPVEPGTHALTVVLEDAQGRGVKRIPVEVRVERDGKGFVNVRTTGRSTYVRAHPAPS